MEYYSGGKYFIIHAHNNIDEPQEVYARFKKKKKTDPRRYILFTRNSGKSKMNLSW